MLFHGLHFRARDALHEAEVPGLGHIFKGLGVKFE